MKMYQLKAAQVRAQTEQGLVVHFSHQGHDFTITANNGPRAWQGDLVLTEVANGKTYPSDSLADLKEMAQLTVDCHKEKEEKQRRGEARRQEFRAKCRRRAASKEAMAGSPITVRELQVNGCNIGRVAFVPLKDGFIFYPFVTGRAPSRKAYSSIDACIPRWARSMKPDLVVRAELLPGLALADCVREVWATCWDQGWSIHRALDDLGLEPSPQNMAHLEARILDDQGNLRLMPHTPGAWDNHCQ